MALLTNMCTALGMVNGARATAYGIITCLTVNLVLKMYT